MATKNAESAGVLRELAGHHAKEAAGAASEAPRGSERFQGPPPVPTDAELRRLAASADTAADHRAVASYFTTIAERYEREAKESSTYASSWRGMTRNPAAPTLAARWERLAKQQHESAVEARTAATVHRDHAARAK